MSVKDIVVRYSAKPYVFGGVLPVATGASPLLSLPGNPVANDESFRCRLMNRRRCMPVAANVHGSRRFQHRPSDIEQISQPPSVLINRLTSESAAIERLVEIIRRVENKEINRAGRKCRKNGETVGVNRRVERKRATHLLPTEKATRETFTIVGGQRNCLVSRRTPRLRESSRLERSLHQQILL